MVLINRRMLRSRRLKSHRSAVGSGISEFGPAIWILLIFFFLPMVDAMSLGVSYCLCTVLNTNQVHEATLLKASLAQDPNNTVKKTIPEQWQNGMGKFVKVVGPIDTQVSYSSGQAESGSDQITDQMVTVTTTVKCSPFLPVPVPVVNVPGLNGPLTFQINSQRQMENPDDAKL